MSISVQGLTKVYGTQRAVDTLNFELEPGEVLGFLGPNGAGKSTTMKMLTCFISPTEGEATVGGHSIYGNPLDIRRQVGYLPEHNPLYLDMYVHEFLNFVGKVHRLEASVRKERIAKVIEMTGLQREQHKKITMLSKGYRQRVGLAQALIHDPSVLILDEPTSGLDPNQIADIRQLILDVSKDKTVIFSSHILSEVEAIAKRVIIINQGKVVADDNIDSLRKHTQNETVIYLELEKEQIDFEGLKEVEGFRKIEPLSETSFEIYSESESDLRRPIFELCSQQDNAILSLKQEVFSLEDMFRQLTKN